MGRHGMISRRRFVGVGKKAVAAATDLKIREARDRPS